MLGICGNLKPEIVTSRELDLDGFVCSYQNAGSRGFELEMARAANAWLLVDNGNITDIRQRIAEWVPVFARSEVSGHPALAERLRDVLRASFGAEQSLQRLVHQVQVGGHVAVGHEDLTLPVLVAAGAELAHEQWLSLAEATQQAALLENQRLASLLDRDLSPGWAAGFQAVDYDSGVIAGRLAAGWDGPATLGLGGLLGMSGSVDHRFVDGIRQDLARAAPSAYVRACEAVFGFVAGCSGGGEARTASLHLLGLGVPVLIPIVACAAHAGGLPLSLDSTSPIYDAHAGGGVRLYVDNPAPMKYRAAKIVQYWIDDDIPWGCPCPHCGDILSKYPHDPALARRLRPDSDTLSDADLSRTPLGDAMPLFSSPSDPEIGREVRAARIRHNHWSLLRIRDRVREAAEAGALVSYVDDAVRGYAEHSASAYWIQGVLSSFDFLGSTLERMMR